MRKIYLLFLMLMLPWVHNGQISYSYDWEPTSYPTGQEWSSTGSGTFARNTTTPCAGSASARANNYYNNESFLVSPALTGTNGGDLTVSFKYKVTNYNSNTTGASATNFGELRVEWAPSLSGPWSLIHKITSQEHVVSASCAIKTVTGSGLVASGSVFVRFVAISGTTSADNFVYIDDVVISQGPPPTCLVPSNGVLTALSATSASFSWSAPSQLPANGYSYEVRATNGAVVAQGVTAAGVLNASAEGLDAQTVYNLYVKSVCGTGDESSFVQLLNFTTPCATLPAPTTVETFASYTGAITTTSLPCWQERTGATIDGVLTGTTSAWSNGNYNNTTNSNGNALYINLYGDKNEWMISPSIDLGSPTGPKFRLKYNVSIIPYYSTDPQLVTSMPVDKSVTVLISTDNGLTWSSANTLMVYNNQNIPNSNYNNGLPEIINLHNYSGTVKFAFFAKSATTTGDFRFYIDNFVVESIPDCAQINSVLVSDLTKNSAKVSFSELYPIPVDGVHYEVRTTGTPGTPGAIQVGTIPSGVNFVNLIELLPSTNYQIYFRAACSATEWTSGKSFTTLCDYPDIISADDETRCGAGTVTFDVNSDEGVVKWYNSANAFMPFHTGNSYTTPVLSENASYWIATESNSGVSGFGGLATPGNATAASPSNNYGLYFNVLEGINLISTDVYSTSSGTIGVKIFDPSGTEILNISNIAIANGGLTTPNVISLNNIYLPPGIGYRLKIVSPTGVTLYRNTSGLSYPMVDPLNALNVTSGDYIGVTTSSYYYFYNIVYNKVCLSPRVELEAIITPAPELTLSETEFEICEGQSVSVTIAEGAENYDSYVWEPATGVSGNATTGWTFTPTESTVYTLVASQTTGDLCAFIDTVEINVKQLPLVLSLGDANMVCLNEVKELKIGDDTMWTLNYLNSFETDALEGFVQGGTGVAASISTLVSSVGTHSLNLYTSNSANGNVTLSQSLNLEDFTNPYLTFDHIAAMEGSGDYSYDYGYVDYSLDGGVTWIPFKPSEYIGSVDNTLGSSETIGQRFSTRSYLVWKNVITNSSSNPTNALWKTERFNFPANIDLSNVKIRFRATADSGTNYKGWFIDNVNIKEGPPTTATWLPVTNLYTDALATIPYVEGTHAGTVYFKSDTEVSATDYTVTVTSFYGCEVTETTSISVSEVVTPVVADQSICSTEVSNITVTGLQTGGTVKWYETETSTEELDEIPATGTYFVEQVVGTCKSARVSAVITLNLQLPAPVAPIDQKFCLDTVNTSYTVADLEATATTGTIGWFLNEDETTPLALTDVLATGTYYVAEFNGTCWSPKTEVEVAIGTMPAAPNGASQAFCSSLTLGDVEVGQVPGATVNWYATADVTETLDTESVLTDATYYVSQIIGFCESERVAIQIQLIPVFDAPIAPSPVLYCQETTFDDLEVTLLPGGTKGWFTTIATAEPNIALTDIVTTGTYYVAQYNGACWSNKTPVVVTVNPTPDALNNAPQTLCGTFTLADAELGQMSNATVKFYTTADSDVVLPMTTPLVTGTYYVSQTLNGCESTRVAVQFTVYEVLEAPEALATQFYCGPTTFADLSATPTTGVIGWFASEDATTPLDNAASVSTGVYYVAQVNGTCWSPKTMVTVTVNSVPTSLNSTAQQLCGTFTLADAVLGQAPNSVVMFYPDATSEDAMELTSPLVTGTYYVSQIVLGCESPRVAVSFVVNEILVAPQAPAAQLYCGPTTVASLSATPTTGTIGWFASEDATIPLVSTTSVSTGTYYVAQLNGLCWSDKVAVAVTVNPVPAALDTTPQQLCGTFTLANAVLGQAGNAVLKFYTSPTSNAILPLTTPLVTGTYYVSQTVGGCESPRVAVDFVVNEVLPAPQAPAVQTFCGPTTVASLNATPTTGTIGWFTSQDGTTPLNMATSISSGTFYVAQLNGLCWSPKTAVNVSVNPVPVPPSNNDIQLCGNYNFGQVSIGQMAGATLKWYISATATTPIQSSTNVTSGTYYVSQTVGGCESVRVAVNISQTDALSNPSAVSQTFCGTATVADLVAQPSAGATIVWYQSATAISPLAPGTLLATGTYYAAQTRNGCTSNRVPISVFVVSVTAPNVAPFNFCGSATVADLALPTPTGVIFKWFDSPSNPTPLANNVALTTGTYFVSRSQYGCESLRTPVYVTINSIPDAPTGVTPQVFMQGATINDLVMDQPNVVWYATLQNAQNGINPLVQGMPLTNGATYYGVIIGTNGCPSLPFALTVDVYLSDDKFVKNELKYYPNPVEDLLTITYSERILQIEIFDLLGKRIKVKSTDDHEVNIDLSDLASGTYMVQLKTENKSQFLKIVKK